MNAVKVCMRALARTRIRTRAIDQQPPECQHQGDRATRAQPFAVSCVCPFAAPVRCRLAHHAADNVLAAAVLLFLLHKVLQRTRPSHLGRGPREGTKYLTSREAYKVHGEVGGGGKRRPAAAVPGERPGAVAGGPGRCGVCLLRSARWGLHSFVSSTLSACFAQAFAQDTYAH